MPLFSAYVLTPMPLCVLAGFLEAKLGSVMADHYDRDDHKIYTSCFARARVSSLCALRDKAANRFSEDYTEEGMEILELESRLAEVNGKTNTNDRVKQFRYTQEQAALRQRRNNLVGRYVVPINNYAQSRVDMLKSRYELQLFCFFTGVKLSGRYNDLLPNVNRDILQLMTPDERKRYLERIIPQTLFKSDLNVDQLMKTASYDDNGYRYSGRRF